MYKILIAFVLATLAAGPAAASEKTDVMAVLQRFIDAFNKGDMKSALATCADVTSVIDDFPPHECTAQELAPSGLTPSSGASANY